MALFLLPKKCKELVTLLPNDIIVNAEEEEEADDIATSMACTRYGMEIDSDKSKYNYKPS